MKKIEDVCKVIVAKMVKQEEDEWPPSCWGTFYQPERPDSKSRLFAAQEVKTHRP